jgi:hypothetical protein
MPVLFAGILQLGTCTVIHLTQNENRDYFSCIFNYLGLFVRRLNNVNG